MDLYKLDMNWECGYKKMQTQTPISDTQKGRLEKIVIENNTYARYYDAKHAKADSGLVAKFKKEIAETARLDKLARDLGSAKESERETIREKHRKECNEKEARQEKELDAVRKRQAVEDKAMEARHDKELDASQAKFGAKIEVLTQKSGKIESELKEAGLEFSYVRNDIYRWQPYTGRFHDEYQNWLRDLRARIITATSAEEAKALVDEFLLK